MLTREEWERVELEMNIEYRIALFKRAGEIEDNCFRKEYISHCLADINALLSNYQHRYGPKPFIDMVLHILETYDQK